MSTTDGLDANSSINNTSGGMSHNVSVEGAGLLAAFGTLGQPSRRYQPPPPVNGRPAYPHMVNSKAYAIDTSTEADMVMDTDDEVQMTITMAGDGVGFGDERRVSPNSPFAPTVAGGEPLEYEQPQNQQFYALQQPLLTAEAATYVPLNIPMGLYPSPPLTMLPNELSDRARLMATITTLSTQCQRLAIQVSHYEQRLPAIPPDVLASFDPIIADAHIAKLNGQVAQLALLRAVDKRNTTQLENELESAKKSNRMLGDRVAFLERSLDAERQSAASAESVRQQNDKWESEVKRLREAENALTRENNKLQSAAMAEAIRVIDERSPQKVGSANLSSDTPRRENDSFRIERVFLEMDEQAARQDMLLSSLYEPLIMALDAGLAWHRAAAKVGQQASSSPNSSSTITEHNASQQELDTLVAKSDAEGLRHRVLFLESHIDRLERALKRERQRCEAAATDHMERLEAIATSRARDRQMMLDTMLPEIEARLRQAYREGQEAGRAKANEEFGITLEGQSGSTKRYRKTRNSTSATTTPRIHKDIIPQASSQPIVDQVGSAEGEGSNVTTVTVAAPSPPIRFSNVGDHSHEVPTPPTTAKAITASSFELAKGLALPLNGAKREETKHSDAANINQLSGNMFYDGTGGPTITDAPAEQAQLLPRRLEMRH